MPARRGCHRGRGGVLHQGLIAQHQALEYGELFVDLRAQADQALVEAFGSSFINYFTRIKQSEITRHEQAVDREDWQRREYFSRI